jgi:hypothetical protein
MKFIALFLCACVGCMSDDTTPMPDAQPDYFQCWDVPADQPCDFGFCDSGDGTAVNGVCLELCDRGTCPANHRPVIYDGYNCACEPTS